MNRPLEWSHTLLNGEMACLADAESAVAELGDAWRLPTVKELFPLVDQTRYDPAIDIEMFSDTASTSYWTSSPFAWDFDSRWVVDFGDGFVISHDVNRRACVRACREVRVE